MSRKLGFDQQTARLFAESAFSDLIAILVEQARRIAPAAKVVGTPVANHVLLAKALIEAHRNGGATAEELEGPALRFLAAVLRLRRG